MRGDRGLPDALAGADDGDGRNVDRMERRRVETKVGADVRDARGEHLRREREPAAWVEDRLVGEVDGDLGAARPLLDERQPVVRHAAQLLAPAHEAHGDELVRQLVEGVANHVGIVLAVDDRQGSHRVVVTSSSMRAVYFSYVFVSVENWMIFS